MFRLATLLEGVHANQSAAGSSLFGRTPGGLHGSSFPYDMDDLSGLHEKVGGKEN